MLLYYLSHLLYFKVRRVNLFFAPKDKLYCIFNCCRLVNRALRGDVDEVIKWHYVPSFRILQLSFHDHINTITMTSKFFIFFASMLRLQDGNATQGASGADEFLPLLIVTLIQVQLRIILSV